MIHEDPFYTWEKYYLATLTLATGSDTLEERLYDVWISHFMGLKPEQFPVQVREKHTNIYSTLELAAKPMGYEMRPLHTLANSKSVNSPKTYCLYLWISLDCEQRRDTRTIC